jgi:pimeloyl-ACP methyl ester carboxylesterase
VPRVRTNEIETYYEIHGPESARPIVFVHGAWVDRRLWRPQVEALSEDYRVITYDLRGHGRTGPAVGRNYTIELLAADLRALVGALDLDRPVVCGLSLGGMVAQLYAVRYGGLAGLVLADTAVSTRLTRRDRLQRLCFPRWVMTATVGLLGPERYVDWAFRLTRLTRSADWFGRDPDVQEYVRETMSAFDTAAFTAALRAFLESLPATNGWN